MQSVVNALVNQRRDELSSLSLSSTTWSAFDAGAARTPLRENMGLISGYLDPTQRTHLLEACCAAVQGQLVVIFTQVAFGGVDFDFHKIGVGLSRHYRCSGCWIQDSCWMVETSCRCCPWDDEAVRLYYLRRKLGGEKRIEG